MLEIRYKKWINMSWLYATWLQFLIRYRKTILGPAWILVGPVLFILVLGSLYSNITSAPADRFVPYLTVGLVTWTLISGFVTGSTTVFQRGKARILQGTMALSDIVMVDIFTHILTFVHQLLIVGAVLFYYGISLSLYSLISLIGLALLIINGIWLGHFFGIIGARYRDLSEVAQAVMRIAFLATPIIWMPQGSDRGGALGAYLTFNPFYHFLELVRAPLLGAPIAPLSWGVVITITVLGFGLSYWFQQRFSRFIPLWI